MPAMVVQRELLPAPIPFPDVAAAVAAFGTLSRSSRRRLAREVGWQQWANDGVNTVNDMYGRGHFSWDRGATPSSGQRRCLDGIADAYRRMGSDFDLSPQDAFENICGQRPGYDEPGPRASFQKGMVSFPPPDLLPLTLGTFFAVALFISGIIGTSLCGGILRRRPLCRKNLGFAARTPTPRC